MARPLIASIAFLALASLVGCSSGPAGEVKLGVDVAAIRTTTSTTTTADAAGLVVTRVRVLVAHAKVGYTGGKSTGASAEVGPFVVDLTGDEIAKGAHRDFSLGTLDSGTYGGAEIEIQPLDAGDDQTDPAVADFVAAGASVLVDGTYQGKAFNFAGHFLAEQGTDGDVTIDAAKPLSLAMTVDPSGWFVDAAGASVNPGDEAQHTTLAAAVCTSLDTQQALAAATAPAGKGGKGGGGQAHCVAE
ncbi:MAG: hypothetical protein ABJE95_16900 [Byssovorax sp.]